MSCHENIERSKLNQAMYKKLKKYIMNKRKQQVEQKEHDDNCKRVMLEKAKRKRQAQIDHENMESLQKELMEATKKRDDLRDQKNSLFTRFKQLANDESILKDRQKSEVQQMTAVNLPRSYHLQNIPDQISTAMSNSAIPTSMLGYNANKIEPLNDTNPHLTNHSPMTMTVNDLATVIRYSGLSPALLEALYKNNNTQRLLNQAVVSSFLNNASVGLANQNAVSTSTANGLLANSNLSDSTLAALFANINNPAVSALLAPSLMQVDPHSSNISDNNPHLSQSQSLNPLLAHLEKYGGGISAQTLAALSQQQESIRQAPNNSQRILESLKQLSNTNNPVCFDSYSGSQMGNSAVAYNNLVNSSVMGSSLLPPAPTSYRGSITTGQSAQNIQLQVYQQQQQQQHMLMAAAAKLVNNHNSAPQSSQSGSSHLGVLPQHHSHSNLPAAISTNVLQLASPANTNSGRQAVHDNSALFTTSLDPHPSPASFYSRNMAASAQNGQQSNAVAAAAAVAAAFNYNNQAQLVHHLNTHGALTSSQNYRQTMPTQQQQQPPHSVHNSYF